MWRCWPLSIGNLRLGLNFDGEGLVGGIHSYQDKRTLFRGARERDGLLKAESVICKTLLEHFENKKSIFFPSGVGNNGEPEKDMTSTKSSHIGSAYKEG